MAWRTTWCITLLTVRYISGCLLLERELPDEHREEHHTQAPHVCCKAVVAVAAGLARGPGDDLGRRVDLRDMARYGEIWLAAWRHLAHIMVSLCIVWCVTSKGAEPTVCTVDVYCRSYTAYSASP